MDRVTEREAFWAMVCAGGAVLALTVFVALANQHNGDPAWPITTGIVGVLLLVYAPVAARLVRQRQES